MKQKKKLPQLTLMPIAELETAAECLKMISHPLRLRMIEAILQAPLPVYRIAEICKLSHAQTTGHLRKLLRCGLLTSKRNGREVIYHPNQPQLQGLILCIKGHCKKKSVTVKLKPRN